MRILVLDTSAFIQGFDTSDMEIQLYSTPLVINEIRDEIAKIRAINWSQTGKLVVQMPEGSSLKHVLVYAEKMGEVKALSETDYSVLALTLQLANQGNQTTLVSDDYSVQNLADELELNYTGMNTKGIQRRFWWVYYCPGCRKQFKEPQSDNMCPICGTELRRKPGEKSRRRSVE